MDAGGRDRGLFGAATICLVLIFVWGLMPVDESPSPTLKTLSIVLELGLVIGFVGLAPRVLRSLPAGSPRGGWIFLLIVGVVAAMGILGLRLSSGPRVELPPRTSIDSTEARDIAKRLRSFTRASAKVGDRFVASRWMQALATRDPAQIRTLTRQDLQDARAICRDLQEWIEQILKVFAEAESKGIDVSGATTVPGANRPETWRAAREGFNSAYDYMGVIGEHWDEWLANPFPAGQIDLKPWQYQVQRLGDETAARSKQFNALLEP